MLEFWGDKFWMVKAQQQTVKPLITAEVENETRKIVETVVKRIINRSKGQQTDRDRKKEYAQSGLWPQRRLGPNQDAHRTVRSPNLPCWAPLFPRTVASEWSLSHPLYNSALATRLDAWLSRVDNEISQVILSSLSDRFAISRFCSDQVQFPYSFSFRLCFEEIEGKQVPINEKSRAIDFLCWFLFVILRNWLFACWCLEAHGFGSFLLVWISRFWNFIQATLYFLVPVLYLFLLLSLEYFIP